MASSAVPTAQQLLHAVEDLLKSAASIVGHGAKTPSPPPAASGATTPTELADDAAQIASIRDGMQAMRDDLTQMGTGLGAILTTVLGAIGYTQIHSIFPFPRGAPGWIGPGALAAAVAGIGGATFLIFRFFFAKRRILLFSEDQGATVEPRRWVWHRIAFWEDEKRLATKAMHEWAKSEDKSRLEDVEKEAEDKAKAARRETDPALSKSGWAEAYRLYTVVDLALWDASQRVLERRTRAAFSGLLATVAIILTVGGIGFLFGTADWAKGQRSLPEQAIRQAEACVARAQRATDPLVQSLTAACIAKAKADLGATTGATTTTAPATTSTTTPATTTTK